VHAGLAHLLRHLAREDMAIASARCHRSCALKGMHTTLRHQLLDSIIVIIKAAKPLLDDIRRKDRDLASQLQRALSSIALNVAEGFGCQAGNARLRFQSALGSLYEAQAALRIAAAWGYVSEAGVNEVVRKLQAYGGRIYGLSRR